MDSGDKATNKAMAIAFKYACFQVFCIPTEEMKDPDAECHEIQKKEADRSKPPAAEEEKPPASDSIGECERIEIMNEIIRTGVTMQTILETYGLTTLNDMSTQQFHACMKKFSATPSKRA